VARHPVTNREFVSTLARVLGRPAILPFPTAAVRLLFGEMGDELPLTSTRVEPRRVDAPGFSFRKSELEPALRHLLGRT
jgi:NAD dependent epimerase/dehydratase family enzyme